MRHPTLSYLGSIALLTFMLSLPAWWISRTTSFSLLQTCLMLALVIVPVSSVAVILVNNLVTQVLPPRVLPKLSFKKGIPPDCRTMVVVPCLLTDEEELRYLLHQLELHYLGNADPNLSFALLSDFPDAPQQKAAGDERILASAVEGIQSLNRSYAPEAPAKGPFLPFSTAGVFGMMARTAGWAGKEKRGKIMEFNSLILEQGETFLCYKKSVICKSCPGLRYVITLDADTSLTPGTACPFWWAHLHTH